MVKVLADVVLTVLGDYIWSGFLGMSKYNLFIGKDTYNEASSKMKMP
jgi:hypothetical protein